MQVHEYSQWEYKLLTDDDVMECVSCNDEIGMGYVIAESNSSDDINSKINTNDGPICSTCLASMLSQKIKIE